MISTTRGQTTLDFAVGTGVFLLAVLFVVTYAPTMFDPFAGGSGTELIVADRAATTLSSDLLAASTSDPGILSAGCVAEFFEVDADEATCEAGASFTDFDGALSLDGRSADVTIHDLSASASDPADPDWTDGGDELHRSSDGSTPTDIAVATRTVSIDDQQYRLTVRVW
ncbi:MAG: DUF7287 family protein [Halobacteriota archaeon]|uniref:DUF7287 family protein n=1 Tax=Natronomonas sp. TaxID=2184060 RepID=UPI003976028C